MHSSEFGIEVCENDRQPRHKSDIPRKCWYSWCETCMAVPSCTMHYINRGGLALRQTRICLFDTLDLICHYWVAFSFKNDWCGQRYDLVWSLLMTRRSWCHEVSTSFVTDAVKCCREECAAIPFSTSLAASYVIRLPNNVTSLRTRVNVACLIYVI